MSIRWPASAGRAHARGRLRAALGALGLVLAAAPAAAQLAGGPVANDVCRTTSNRVNQLRDAIRSAADAAGYTGGLGAKACAKFVKEQVKICVKMMENGTDCRENYDRMESKIQKGECKEEETKPDRKACEQVAVLTHEASDETSNTLRVIGNNNCTGAFKTAMEDLCALGPP